jgi:DNA-binding NtrC family response regulator
LGSLVQARVLDHAMDLTTECKGTNFRGNSMTAQRVPVPTLSNEQSRWLQLGLDLRAAAGSDGPLLITGRRDATFIVARAIHDHNYRRPAGRFVSMRRDTMSETLASLSTIPAGHASGSSKSGRGDAAAMLFISDVDELPSSAQEMVMYFLDVVYAPTRSASGQELGTARVVAATTKDLSKRVAAGLFQADLFYRLNTIHLQLPILWSADDSRLRSLLASL